MSFSSSLLLCWQISNVESSVAEPFYPALDERDGAPSALQASNVIALHHQPNCESRCHNSYSYFHVR